MIKKLSQTKEFRVDLLLNLLPVSVWNTVNGIF